MFQISNILLSIKENKGNFIQKALFCLVMVVYFSFGFHHLSDFISADEHFWLPNSGQERIQNYWSAIAEHDWEDTRINDKPGITLAYTSGIALLFEKDLKSQLIKGSGTTRIYDTEKTKSINFAFRLPILLLSGLFSIFFFWIIKKLTESDWIALFAVAGIYLSPILIGMSQIVNPDSLFWIFGISSVFSFMAFLKIGEKKFGILAGIFLGLSLASKYVSVIFFPFFFLMMLGYYLFEYENLKKEEGKLKETILKYGTWYVGILAGGMLIFAVMMPASFVDPRVFYEGTIGFPGMSKIFWSIMSLNILLLVDAKFFASKGADYLLGKLQPLKIYLPRFIYALLSLTVIFVLINWITRHNILNLSNIPFDAKRKESFSDLPVYKIYIMEFVALVFSLTPITLFALLFIWIKSIFKEGKHALLVFLLSSFFLVFYAAVIIQGLLVTTRYSIILYPMVMVLVAVAIEEFFSLRREDKGNKLAVVVYFAILAGILCLHVFSLFEQSTLTAIKTRIDYYGPNYLISLCSLLIFLTAVVFIVRKYFPWSRLQKTSRVLIFAIFVIFNIGSIFLISPFYFSYTNDLLPKKYIISGAWGYGGYEAAQYLNSLPNSQNLTVWADVYGVCEFFVGKCIHKAKVDVAKNPIDYYFQSLQATIGLNFPHPMEKKEVWRMEIDGRGKSFLKIRKAKKTDTPSVQEDNSSLDNSFE